MNAGLAAYLAKKKGTPVATSGAPMVPMHPAMVNAIKQSPKGVLPPGLVKYLAAKKAAKQAPTSIGTQPTRQMLGIK